MHVTSHPFFPLNFHFFCEFSTSAIRRKSDENEIDCSADKPIDIWGIGCDKEEAPSLPRMLEIAKFLETTVEELTI